jgi:hypothetical protein
MPDSKDDKELRTHAVDQAKRGLADGKSTVAARKSPSKFRKIKQAVGLLQQPPRIRIAAFGSSAAMKLNASIGSPSAAAVMTSLNRARLWPAR